VIIARKKAFEPRMTRMVTMTRARIDNNNKID